MAFDPAPVTEIRATIDPAADLLIAWTTTADPGSYYQVYVDGRLAWHGTSTRCTVPTPTRPATVHVGVVPASEIKTDHSGSLASVGGTGNRVTLNWTGGTYLDPTGGDDVAGFRVYQGTAPGGATSYATPVGTVPAYAAGVILDGWGLGRWGHGGWGRADSLYSWTSPPLASGTWNFGVRVYNAAGIEGTALTFSQAVLAPPAAPSYNAAGKRLVYSLNVSTRVPTISWLAPA